MATHPPPLRFRDYTNLPFEAFIAAFTVLPILVLIYFYHVLPESIPEYLNLRGGVEVWGRKGFASVFRLPLMAIDLQMLCVLIHFPSTAVRAISWAAAIFGIVGAVFYGYRLVMLNRKLKEAGGKYEAAQQTATSHLHGGILYYNPADPSLFKDKYLFNFANKWVYVFLG